MRPRPAQRRAAERGPDLPAVGPAAVKLAASVAVVVLSCTLTLADDVGAARAHQPDSAAATPALPAPFQWLAPRKVTLGAFITQSTTQYGRNLDDYTALTGQAPEVVNLFTNWDGVAFPASAVGTVAARGAVPMVTWQPSRSGEALASWDKPKLIASGRDDDYIRTWARAAAAFGRPLYLRFGHEMNGDWYTWARVYDNTPADYIAMWRHVHAIFDQVGVKNVKWVWCPNVVYDHASDPEPFYPGDKYVDVVGLDGYNRGTDQSWSRWQYFGALFGPTLDRVATFAHKPIWVVETGSTERGGSKAAWVTDMFAAVMADQRIAGLLYFNSVGSGNWPLTTSTDAVAAYRAGAALLVASQRQVVPVVSLTGTPAATVPAPVGSSVQLAGVVTNANTRLPVAGVQVTLTRTVPVPGAKPGAPQTQVTPVGTPVVTGRDGRFVLATTSSKDASYAASAAGQSSPAVLIAVAPTVQVSLASTKGTTRTLRFTGRTADDVASGTPVTVERLNGSTWVLQASGRTGTGGAFTLTATATARGTYVFRAVMTVARTGTSAADTRVSAPVSITLR